MVKGNHRLQRGWFYSGAGARMIQDILDGRSTMEEVAEKASAMVGSKIPRITIYKAVKRARSLPRNPDSARTNLERFVALGVDFLGAEVKERMARLEAEASHYKAEAEENKRLAETLESRIQKGLLEKAGVKNGD